jgi:hypothetical protein
MGRFLRMDIPMYARNVLIPWLGCRDFDVSFVESLCPEWIFRVSPVPVAARRIYSSIRGGACL